MGSYARVVIAGVKGGSGKTTVCLSIIAAMRSEKNLRVAPFKKGPDYIDAGWLSLAVGTPCYTLDPFLIAREKILESFFYHFSGNVAVIEGNRGLHDGMDVEGSCSTAEVSKLLRAPVILVVDCTKITRTAAAIVLGCMNMDPDVKVQGVILNQVSGKRHESVIRASIEKYCALPVLGAIPRLESGEFPERHMGLTPYHEHPDSLRALSFVRDIGNRYLDMEGILNIAREAEPLTPGFSAYPCPGDGSSVRIGVIRDSAFQFYYPENIEELERNGAEIIEVHAMEDDRLPKIDGLYIGGGFPETHAISLAENHTFRASLRRTIEEGLPVYAECGGLMYLGEGLLLDGRTYPMLGIFPLSFSLEKKPHAHGYSVIEVIRQNPFFPEGVTLKGHEFHYSRPMPCAGIKIDGYFAFRVMRGQGILEQMDGLCYQNVLATYTHLHAYGAEEWVQGMIQRARNFKNQKHAAAYKVCHPSNKI
jgi:cobyrinic acid a,c-diamide synthase